MPKPSAVLPNPEIKPEPKVEKRTRRKFTVKYKLDILRQADACAYGELGALLRREKLYSSQLAQWRREFAAAGVDGIAKSTPGPAPTQQDAQQRIEQLEAKIAKLERLVSVKDQCIALQKKAFALIEQIESAP